MGAKSATGRHARRDFITGRAFAQEEHLASVLVHTRPERLAALESRLARLPGVESHGSSAAGKLVVTIEVGSDAELVDRMTRIETEDGVIAATLVYHQVGGLDDEA